MKRLLAKYFNFKPFSQEEAWAIFRIAAFAEAIGWTILIIGILLTDYVFGGNRTAVILAGRTHGIFFGLYLVAVLVLSPSLNWNWKRIIIAGLMSIPPYGTLIFEIWANQQRKHRGMKLLGSVILYKQLI